MCNGETKLKMFNGAETTCHTVCPECTIRRSKGEHALIINRPPVCLGMPHYNRYLALKTDITNYYNCLTVEDFGDKFTISI